MREAIPGLYLISIGFIILCYFGYKTYLKQISKGKSINLRFKVDPKLLFIVVMIIFLGFLFLEIFLNIIRSLKNSYFFTFYLDLFFLNIGFFGIIGILLSYFWFDSNKRLFLVLELIFLLVF